MPMIEQPSISPDGKNIAAIFNGKDEKGNRIDVEYSLKDINKPMGVADFKLTDAVPENLKSSLPTIEEIEQ